MTLEARLERLEQNRRLNLREQYDQLETLQSRPLHVAIPTGDRCNLRCVFCTDRSPSSPIRYTDQTFKQFLRFTEPMDSALLVQLYGWGEPFINPDYGKMFDYVAERFAGARIYISTNGVLLTQKWIKKIVTYGKCLVNVSLNAATPETYARLTQQDRFDRVVGNTRKLMQAREKNNAQDLLVTLSFTATRLNIHELPRFIELSDELGIRFVVLQDLNILEESHVGLSLGAEEKKAHRMFRAAAKLARKRGIYLDSFIHHPGVYFMQDRSECASVDLPRDCLSIWEQDDEPLFYPQAGECYEPWQTLLISQNGAVTTCCRAREVMGNLLEQSLEEIWNGEVYRAYRRTINTFRPPEACLWCPVKTGHDIR